MLVQHEARLTRKIAIGDSLSACLALSELNPQNMAFGRKRLSGHILLPRYQKSPYTPPTRLRRRNALVQRIAKSTRKSQPSVASNYQADFYSQGIKRPAYTPPTRLRRRNALVQRVAKSTRKSQPSVASNYQADFYSQGIKRPAYTPPTRLRRRNALVQRIAKSTRKSQPSVASNYQADFYSQGIKRPAYTPPAFDGLYFLRFIEVICADFRRIIKLE